MKTADVKKLKPLDQFYYWIRERHQIFVKRGAGLPKPWTDDEVLQSFFFTNPYRENDKVTQWFRENIREPLKDRPEVLFATVCFRWFNLPSTGLMLGQLASDDESKFDWGDRANLLVNWNPKEALRRLSVVREHGGQVFTGAFMVNSPPGEPKLEAIVRRINNVWEDLDDLQNFFRYTSPAATGPNSLQEAHERLMEYDGMGGFMAYEVVTDLRYTRWLEAAPDKLLWCNPGPGCIRGLYRVLELPFEKGNNSSSPPKPEGWLEHMKRLLDMSRIRLGGMPKLEMREIEHSLCEYDKYCRALYGDGKLKRRYAGK